MNSVYAEQKEIRLMSFFHMQIHAHTWCLLCYAGDPAFDDRMHVVVGFFDSSCTPHNPHIGFIYMILHKNQEKTDEEKRKI